MLRCHHNAFLESCHRLGLSIWIQQRRMYKGGSRDSLPGRFLGKSRDVAELDQYIFNPSLLVFVVVPVAELVPNQFKEFK